MYICVEGGHSIGGTTFIKKVPSLSFITDSRSIAKKPNKSAEVETVAAAESIEEIEEIRRLAGAARYTKVPRC